jgi:hypothetical protein
MPERTKLAFQSQLKTISIKDICPLKDEITPAQRSQFKYQQIAVSVLRIGLVEPLVVFSTDVDQYLLVDGHTRLDILKQNGINEAECLVATDDEAYTYNKRTNYLPPIAEHYMILKALTNGVSEQRIAETLNVNVADIRRKRDLLNGICPEAVELLKTHRVKESAFCALRRMKPVRQIRCAELMISANSYTYSFAKAFLQVTPDELLATLPSQKRMAPVPNSAKNLLEQEAQALVEDLRRAEESYAADMLDLATCCRYLSRLLSNERIRRYLSKHHTDTLTELDQLVAEVEKEKQKPLGSEHRRKQRASG